MGRRRRVRQGDPARLGARQRRRASAAGAVLPASAARPARRSRAAPQAGPGQAGLWAVDVRVGVSRWRGAGGVTRARTPKAKPLTLGSLCTGYGGLDLAIEHVTGAQLAWYADTDPAA